MAIVLRLGANPGAHRGDALPRADRRAGLAEGGRRDMSAGFQGRSIRPFGGYNDDNNRLQRRAHGLGAAPSSLSFTDTASKMPRSSPTSSWTFERSLRGAPMGRSYGIRPSDESVSRGGVRMIDLCGPRGSSSRMTGTTPPLD